MESSDVLALASSRPIVDADDGAVLIRADEPHPALYVLVSGALEVRGGDTAIARLAEPGSIVGELGLLLAAPASADVVAIGPTRVHRIDDAAELFRSDPDFGRHLAVILAQRLRRVTTYLADLQAQFADRAGSLGAVPAVLHELLGGDRPAADVGSEREPNGPY